MALNDTLASLLADPKWNAFAEIVNEEIAASEKKALSSLLSDSPDSESARRAKYLREALELPANRLKASKMNEKKTPI